MRRLLAAIVTCGLLLAMAASALASNRLPRGITKVGVTITFPRATGSSSQRTVHVTLTKASAVAEVVHATDALPVAKALGVCPMIVRLGPDLSVAFRNSSGVQVATARVAVARGSKGDSGSSACFPIRLTRSGKTSELLGNSWVRLMGRLAHTSIS